MGSTLASYVSFLDRRDIVAGGVAFAVGYATNGFFSALIDELVVKPINHVTNFDDMDLVFGSLRLKYGEVVRNLISLLATTVVSFAIVSSALRYLGWT